MIICSPTSTCLKSAACLSGCFRQQMSRNLCIVSQSPSSSCFLYACSGGLQPAYVRMSVCNTYSGSSAIEFQAFQGNRFNSGISKPRGNWHSLILKTSNCSQAPQRKFVHVSSLFQNMNATVLVPKQGILSKIKCNVGRMSWPRGFVSAGLVFGLLVFYTSSKVAHAEAASLREAEDNEHTSSFSTSSHRKKVFMDYSVIGIPGDGRCLFRSVVHGACLRSGKPPPSESLQKEFADELRSSVADEFIRRREETEWFIEGNFDTYVSKMRKPHVWGGEPELLMASHVLQMPITVYMHDEESGGLISIAEYGQEYGKENPIRVLYHGFGHYDALQIPGKGQKPRL